MIMITSATVLVLASAGYLAWDYYRLRADLSSELAAQAQLVLDNSTAALNFHDPAPRPRRSPRSRAVRACGRPASYDARGALFADWHAATAPAGCPPQRRRTA